MFHLRAHTPLPADVLLRHSALRYDAVSTKLDAIWAEAREKAKKLYPTRDRLAFRVRRALVLSGSARREFARVIVSLKDDDNPRLRACRTVYSVTGEVRVLPPRRTTTIKVFKRKGKVA